MDCACGPPDPQSLQASHRIQCLMQVFASAQVAHVGEASVTAALARTAAAFGVDPPQPGCALLFTCVFVASRGLALCGKLTTPSFRAMLSY